jgi:hypothetical protein
MMIRKLALLILAIACAAGCAHTYDTQRSEANICGGGGHGNGNPSKPIVCIDPSTLAADPDPIHLKSGKWIHFFIDNDTGDLDIVFPAGTKVHHKGKDHAHYWAQAEDVTTSSSSKYTIVDRASGRENDPIIIIEP